MNYFGSARTAAEEMAYCLVSFIFHGVFCVKFCSLILAFKTMPPPRQCTICPKTALSLEKIAVLKNMLFIFKSRFEHLLRAT